MEMSVNETGIDCAGQKLSHDLTASKIIHRYEHD